VARLQFRSDRRAATLLATAVVLLGGLSSCIAILLVFAEGRAVPLTIAIGSSIALAILIWAIRERTESRQKQWFAWVFHRGARPARVVYEARKLSPGQQREGNGPPTLEQLREIKQNVNTWVPSNAHLSRRDGG
jgi:hypothetical protein